MFAASRSIGPNRTENEWASSLKRETDSGTIKRIKVDSEVFVCVGGIDSVFRRADEHHELEPSEVSDTLAQALLVESGLMPTGVMDAVIECFQQARDVKHTAVAAQLDFLNDRLDEAETQAQKLRVENEALAAELKRAEIVGIEHNATIICLRTELDLSP